MEIMEEIWKDIEGYEGLYQVSNLGRVKSLDRKIDFKDGRYATYKGRVLSPKIKNGYKYVVVTQNSKYRTFLVHRLVAKAFLPNPENKPCIDHINTDRTDNRVENLRWCTHKENMWNIKTREKMAIQYKKRFAA